jgi:hypothetical protein
VSGTGCDAERVDKDVAPREVAAVFDHLDADGSGAIEIVSLGQFSAV